MKHGFLIVVAFCSVALDASDEMKQFQAGSRLIFSQLSYQPDSDIELKSFAGYTQVCNGCKTVVLKF